VATRTKDLTGQVTGTLKAFLTPENYDTGTLEVHLNGVRLLRGAAPAGDFTETGPAAFEFNAACPAPAVGDTLQVQYEISSIGDPDIFPTVVASGFDPTTC
jgi:hypothetical protein